MKMSFRLLIVGLMALCAGGAWAEGGTSTPVGFTDDYEAALARAKAEKKLIVADFSGSDWCFWCQRLDKEIFSQEAFVSVATNKYVLLMVDRPRDTSRLSEKAKVQNPELIRKYKVSSFPTVLLLDGEGKIQGETGFVGGGPENYLKHLEEKVAEIPDFLAWVKPLDQRTAAFFRRYSEEMSAAVRRAQADGKEAVRRAEGETSIRLADELEKIYEEERTREVPERVVGMRAKQIEHLRLSALQLRYFGKDRLAEKN